ncbi:queuosine biosynthesis protein QueC [Labrenzia sp. THAF82]|uniref:7-cyano-7-deazaguanine synthase n=1 Tax=Labrenzia sp. THAF82 TaxID=2587861 RepID=UPI0012679792|nr:7-cyano-7-deazaguanine synthase [Labrenzia sp. THAF82]QFT34127.1 queuosine biosynthesis protein QueC [Labrenzia sp. THAF82]
MRALLFSGGVESTCLAVWLKPELLVTVDYGQAPAKGELAAAIHLASLLKTEHKFVQAPMAHLGSGDLTGKPSISQRESVPEHWPFRNQMLITLAAMALADQSLTELIIGTVRTDNVHNDGTEDFLEAMNKVLIAQNPKLRLTAPAAKMSTKELVIASDINRDLLGWTFSCHLSSVACGQCRGCKKTIKLFTELETIGLRR